MRNLTVLLFALLLLVVGGCAEGELTEEDTGGEDQNVTANDDNGDDDGDDNGDDNGDDPCDGVTCTDGVCDPDSGECVDCLTNADCSGDEVCDEEEQECVECTEDGDCPDELACDVDGGTCVGCVGDGDCDNDAICHDVYPTCVDACCDFVQEDVFTDIPYSHDRFDIAVTDEGEPTIAFLDGDTDDIMLAERIGGNWYTQQVGDVADTLSTNVRIDLDAEGNPHLVVRRHEYWKYHWRDGSTWYEEDVWDEEIGQSYTDIAVDDDGRTHFIGLGYLYDDDQAHYAVYSPGDGWDRETFEFGEGASLQWTALALTGDNEPVISFTLSEDDDTDIHLARRDGSGWATEEVVDDVIQVHHMAVGPDDEVMVAHRPPETPHDGLELTRDGTGSWETELVNTEEEASTMYLDIDERNDPHIVFQVSGSGDYENYLRYTRWDGNDWETHSVDNSLVERAFWQRIAVDDDYVPHIAVYDSDRSTISYVTLE